MSYETRMQRGCVDDTHAERKCNVLQGVAAMCLGQLVQIEVQGPAPGGTDHPPGGMAVRLRQPQARLYVR